MTIEEHLKISDITAFREGLLSQTEHTKAARHLVRCGDCRNLLPLPTKEEFLKALFGDHSKEIKSSTRALVKGFMARPILSLPAIRNAVFASLLLLVLGFSFLMWIQPGSSVDENLVAVAIDSSEPDDLHNATTPRPMPKDSVTPDGPTADSRSTGPDRDADRTPVLLPGRKGVGNKGGRRPPKKQSSQRAEIRGSNFPCGGTTLVDLEIRKAGDGLQLTWNKVPNAVSYAIYLSDLDERLVDQHETADETSYLVSVPLDSETIYRWKLIATLKNGERIVSESQKFRGGGGRAIPVRKKTASAVRCVEGKQQ